MDYVLFDVGGVVVNADHERTFKFLQDLEVPRDASKNFYNIEEYLRFAQGFVQGIEFGAALNFVMGTNLGNPVIRNAHDMHIYEVAEGMPDQLERIPYDQRGFLTDTNPWQDERVDELIRLRDYTSVERIFRSHEMGMTKADDGCFEKVLGLLDADGDKVLLVDDSPEKIQMAQKYGLETILFTSVAQLEYKLGDYGF